MNEGDSRSMVERYLRALNSGDFDVVADAFDDNVYVEWPQSGERFHGKQACMRVFQDYPGGSPQLVGEPEVTGAGDRWVAQLKLRYPDGKDYFTVSIIELANGKVVHETDYFAEPFEAPAWRKGMLPA